MKLFQKQRFEDYRIEIFIKKNSHMTKYFINVSNFKKKQNGHLRM